MYIKPGYTYYDSGGQHATRGKFLILLSVDNDRGLRAIVRSVALRQFGHWMMGCARVFGKTLTISGAYGSDGLPKNLDRLYYHFDDNYKVVQDCPEWVERVWNSAIPLPAELYDAWNNGGGWNSAGSEAQVMRQWTLENFSIGG